MVSSPINNVFVREWVGDPVPRSEVGVGAVRPAFWKQRVGGQGTAAAQVNLPHPGQALRQRLPQVHAVTALTSGHLPALLNSTSLTHTGTAPDNLHLQPSWKSLRVSILGNQAWDMCLRSFNWLCSGGTYHLILEMMWLNRMFWD